MDIERYLKFNLDMTLVKEVLFDNTQRLVFDTITKLISFKRFFDKNKEKYVDFSSYKKEDYESFFKGIKCMSSRYDTTDNKIIKFIEERIENWTKIKFILKIIFCLKQIIYYKFYFNFNFDWSKLLEIQQLKKEFFSNQFFLFKYLYSFI